MARKIKKEDSLKSVRDQTQNVSSSLDEVNFTTNDKISEKTKKRKKKKKSMILDIIRDISTENNLSGTFVPLKIKKEHKLDQSLKKEIELEESPKRKYSDIVLKSSFDEKVDKPSKNGVEKYQRYGSKKKNRKVGKSKEELVNLKVEKLRKDEDKQKKKMQRFEERHRQQLIDEYMDELEEIQNLKLLEEERALKSFNYDQSREEKASEDTIEEVNDNQKYAKVPPEMENKVEGECVAGGPILPKESITTSKSLPMYQNDPVETHCKKCSFKTYYYTSMGRHLSIQHGIDWEASKNDYKYMIAQIPRRLCQYCKKYFASLPKHAKNCKSSKSINLNQTKNKSETSRPLKKSPEESYENFVVHLRKIMAPTIAVSYSNYVTIFFKYLEEVDSNFRAGSYFDKDIIPTPIPANQIPVYVMYKTSSMIVNFSQALNSFMDYTLCLMRKTVDNKLRARRCLVMENVADVKLELAMLLKEHSKMISIESSESEPDCLEEVFRDGPKKEPPELDAEKIPSSSSKKKRKKSVSYPQVDPEKIISSSSLKKKRNKFITKSTEILH
uniref:Uncharacterized protein n=1 Tax=Lepeophtheirus salmonis TaxID=72036 RepID=A0A0K2U8S7_LEPSM